MSTTAQLQASLLPRSESRRKVYRTILRNPGKTNKQIAELLGEIPGTVSGRVTELKEIGYVASREATGGSLLYAIQDVTERCSIQAAYELEKKRRSLDKVRKELNVLRQDMSAAEVAAIRATLERLKAEL
ncbi:hypothetical protein LEM8419_03492 [Neolewinella maritima]|uniref:Winged helix-turn-helix transcriptional regulator n=1 Tax=Neolewinella maritima TaxID=1383882 RepID=A0ABM9B5F6_9BACT|nr:winged helix-turn-helix domain-containing protein [Neolewinella maritima]CAH1002620.1 hypothetical protein LEM8419_03492 [Neolewinella maritima]